MTHRDDFADEEAELAAEEAAHIGGTPTYEVPLEDEDEAYRAVNEAGAASRRASSSPRRS